MSPLFLARLWASSKGVKIPWYLNVVTLINAPMRVWVTVPNQHFHTSALSCMLSSKHILNVKNWKAISTRQIGNFFHFPVLDYYANLRSEHIHCCTICNFMAHLGQSTSCESLPLYHEIFKFDEYPRYVDEAQDNLLIDALRESNIFILTLIVINHFSSEKTVPKYAWPLLGRGYRPNHISWKFVQIQRLESILVQDRG